MRANTLEEYKKVFGIANCDRYKWILSQVPNDKKKVIDIGCCFGYQFHTYDRDNMVSVDLDDYSHRVPNFVRADARKLPFKDKSFDIAVLGEILEHQPTIEDSKQVLREALRMADKVVLTVPNEYLWSDKSEKFLAYEDFVKQHNVEDEAKKTAWLAKELYSEDDYKHIFHHHHFSPYDIEEMIKELTDKDYYIFILPYDGASQDALGTTAVVIQ